MLRSILACLVLLAVTACTRDDTLHDLQVTGNGPDDFGVLPVRPLEMPPTMSALPRPNPGGPNRVDPNPRAEGIIALGGNPNATRTGGVPARDSALVAAATRNGVAAEIRQVLANEDAAFRSGRAALSPGLFGGDPYYRAYSDQALDAYAEAARFRELGVPTPTAPPAR